MKSTFALLLLLSCLTGLLMAELDHEMASKIMESCMSENGVSEQDLNDLKSGNMKPEDTKDNIKCGTQCVFVKFGFMDAKGKLLQDEIMKHATDSDMKGQMEKALAACGSIEGANPCDTAFMMMDCFMKHAHEVMGL